MKKQDKASETKAQRIIKYYDNLKGRRYNWDSLWDEVSKYVMLDHKHMVYGQYVQGGGEKKFNQLFDATGVHSNELLASALHSMLTNPTSFWFGLETGIPQIDERDDVRNWFQRLTTIMHNILNNSNFQTEIHEVYLGLGGFGTACMRIEPDDEKVVRFHARPIYEVYISENNRGLVDTVYRCFKWTARQIAQEFGVEVLDDGMRAAVEQYSDKQEDEHEIIHAVYPREKWDNKAPKSYQYASCYVLKDKNILLAEGGFRTMPYVVPRWTKVSGETYGRAPSMKALPDIKTLNKVVKTTLLSAETVIAPPLQVPDDGFTLPVELRPRGVTYYRAGTQDRIEPIITGARIDFGFQMEESLRGRIRSAFFIDQLQLQEGPQMTATEVLQRTEEKLRLMGPILGRQNFELLRPMIDRVYDIMLEKNIIPLPIPEILKNRRFQVNYTSQIVKAQRISELSNIGKAIGIAAPIVQADPSAMDNINPDGTLRYVTRLLGLPPEMLRTREEVEEIRQGRQQMAQQQAQQQQAMMEAEQLKNAAPMVKAAQAQAG